MDACVSQGKFTSQKMHAEIQADLRIDTQKKSHFS